MKRTTLWFLSLVMTSLSLTLISCGDDDGDKGNAKECNAIVDGKQTDFQYAYFSVSPYSSGGRTSYEYILEFYNLDFYSYINNPKGLVNKKVSFVTIEFISPTKYDVNSLPTKDFSFGVGNDNFRSCEIVHAKVVSENGELEQIYEQVYDTDWTAGNASGPLSISKTSDGVYKIEIKNLKLLVGKPGEDGAEASDPKTSGSFYFEGRFKDVTSILGD